MIKVIEVYTAEEFEKALHETLSKGFGLVQCFVTPGFERRAEDGSLEGYTVYTAVLIKQTQVAVPIDATKHFGM